MPYSTQTELKRTLCGALTLFLAVFAGGFHALAAPTAVKPVVESVSAFPASLTLRADRGGHAIAVTGRVSDGYEIPSPTQN